MLIFLQGQLLCSTSHSSSEKLSSNITKLGKKIVSAVYKTQTEKINSLFFTEDLMFCYDLSLNIDFDNKYVKCSNLLVDFDLQSPILFTSEI